MLVFELLWAEMYRCFKNSPLRQALIGNNGLNCAKMRNFILVAATVMTTQGSLTRKELMQLYNRGKGVMSRWLHEAGIHHRRSLTPSEIQQLFDKIGPPVVIPPSVSLTYPGAARPNKISPQTAG